MAAAAPAAFCRTSRRGFASPQSARSSCKCDRNWDKTGFEMVT